jgi:hypothetical protein
VARTEPDEFDEAEVSPDELARLLEEVRELRREIDAEATFEEALAVVDPAPRAPRASRDPVALQPPPLTLFPRGRDGAARVLVVIAVVASLMLLAQAYLFSWSR